MSAATMPRLQRQRIQVRLFAGLRRLVDGLAAGIGRLVPPPFRLVQIGSLFWQSRALHVAAVLDLATVLGDDTLPVRTLAQRVGADPDALHRLLRLLAALGIFDRASDGGWRNNRLSTPLRTDRPDSVRAMVLMHNAPEMARPWFEALEAGIRCGQAPFRLTHGSDLPEWLDAHPAFNALFAQAMDQVEALAGDSFATAFDWRAFDRVIDLGGSRGGKARTLLKRHPHLQARVMDRAATIAAVVDASGRDPSEPDASVRERLSFTAGDLLDGVLPSTGPRDVYLLSAVLHGMDDARAERVLRHVAAAMRPTGASLVVMELVLPDQGGDLTGALFDLQMFMGTPGRERTGREWRSLHAKAGLSWVETVALAGLGKMMVLRADGNAL